MYSPTVLALVLAVALWVALGFALARFSGWRILASWYRRPVPDDGMRWYFTSVRLGPLGYRRCMTVGADLRGIRLSMWLPLRFSHPSLFIPWAEIDQLEACRREARPMVWLQVRRAPGVAIGLPRQLTIDALRQTHARGLPPGAHTLLAKDDRPGAPPQPMEST